jgi:hypothetical protein
MKRPTHQIYLVGASGGANGGANGGASGGANTIAAS